MKAKFIFISILLVLLFSSAAIIGRNWFAIDHLLTKNAVIDVYWTSKIYKNAYRNNWIVASLDKHDDSSWNIGVITSYKNVVNSIKLDLFYAFGLVAVTILLEILLFLIFYRKITQPITKIKKIDSEEKFESEFQLKDLTLMFTDINNFNNLSENMSPQELIQYLSDYFQGINNTILENLGTLDKYIGDGAMAFWGAPNYDQYHALHACRAALKIQTEFKKVPTRIGINSGRVIISKIGVFGDNVSLASRLESLNKFYGTNVLVTENTYKLVKDDFKFKFIDKIALKNKKQGVAIYELIGENTGESDLQFEQYNRNFQEAFYLYEKGDTAKALELFSIMSDKYSEDRVIKIFIERCNSMEKYRPNPD